jgi:hypothetical protein
MPETKWNFNEILIPDNPDSSFVDNETAKAALENPNFNPYEGLTSYDLNLFHGEDESYPNNDKRLIVETKSVRDSVQNKVTSQANIVEFNPKIIYSDTQIEPDRLIDDALITLINRPTPKKII